MIKFSCSFTSKRRFSFQKGQSRPIWEETIWMKGDRPASSVQSYHERILKMSVSVAFLQTLSTEAQNAYQIAEYMMNNPGTSIGRAAFQLSKGTWDAARLSNGLSKVTTALETVGGTTGDYAVVEQVVQHGNEAVKVVQLAEAAETAAGASRVTRILTWVGRGILRLIGWETVEGSALALGLGVAATLTLLAALAAATYFGANWLGSQMGDNPILAGSRMSQPASTPVTAQDPTGGKQAVFLLPNSGGTFWIGSEDYLKTLRSCDTPNGGQCNDGQTYPMVTYTRETPDFDTSDQAVAALCSAGTPVNDYWGPKFKAFGVTAWWDGGCPAPSSSQ